MTLIESYAFPVYKDFEAPFQKYPLLKNSAFILNLQTESAFIVGAVKFDFVFGDLVIDFYDSSDVLFQPRITVTEGLNLLYIENYSLYFTGNSFEFYRGDYEDLPPFN